MSHNSSRSLRTKAEARQRPDVVWRDSHGNHELRLDGTSSPTVLAGGTEFAQCIAQADSLLLAMRKIVQ